MLKGWVYVCLVGVPAVSSIFIKLWRHAGGLNASTDAAQVAYVLNVTPSIPPKGVIDLPLPEDELALPVAE